MWSWTTCFLQTATASPSTLGSFLNVLFKPPLTVSSLILCCFLFSSLLGFYASKHSWTLTARVPLCLPQGCSHLKTAAEHLRVKHPQPCLATERQRWQKQTLLFSFFFSPNVSNVQNKLLSQHSRVRTLLLLQTNNAFFFLFPFSHFLAPFIFFFHTCSLLFLCGKVCDC